MRAVPVCFHPVRALAALLLLLVAAGAARCAEPPALPEDALYAEVLKAYRGLTPADQIAALAEKDPGPALYLSEKTPGEWAVTRLFAALPDSAHSTLRRAGYLK